MKYLSGVIFWLLMGLPVGAHAANQDWINRGNQMMDSGRFGDAVKAYEKALTQDPKNVNVLVDLGTCYRELGKFKKAVEQFRTAIKIDPSNPNGHRNLGVVLIYNLHENAEGAKELKRYLELVPNGPDSDSIRQVLKELPNR
jgi:Flp pilus assembly protein TadD